jgi:hypothetical protein
MQPRKTAYVDEAYELGRGGAYVRAAVVLSADTADLREELKDALQMGGQQRPHFRKESHKRRRVLFRRRGKLRPAGDGGSGDVSDHGSTGSRALRGPSGMGNH